MTSFETNTRVLWNYLVLHQTPKPMEAILVFGSNALRVADHGAQLFLEGYGKHLIISGGNGTNSILSQPEATIFKERALKLGVPESAIIIEASATNTGENILFTKKALEEKGIRLSSILLVNKPYMERRTYATAKKLWPEIECLVTSPSISFEDYLKESSKDWIHTMVGSIQRIKDYPEKGFQIPQEIPKKVWEAFIQLREQGYGN